MTTLNVDLWLSEGNASGKRGRESGLHIRKYEKLFHIVRAGLDLNLQVDPWDCTCDVEKNHYVLKVFVVLRYVIQLERTCLVCIEKERRKVEFEAIPMAKFG